MDPQPIRTPSHFSSATVARQLSLDVKTVRRYLAAAKARGVEAAHGPAALDDELVTAVLAALQPSTGRPRGEGWAICETHRELIAQHLEHGVRLTKIGKLLRRGGIEVSYDTVRRFALAELGFGRAAPTVPVADCEPGEEVQVDTGWMTHLERDLFGQRRRFRAWIFTAVRSRHRFVYPIFRETTESAIEACEAAWDFFGGVFKVLIPDNAKAIVEIADPLKPKIVQGFLEYAQARGFAIDTTRVRDDCFGGERLLTIDDARARASHWALEEYGMRRHSTTQRLPREHFDCQLERRDETAKVHFDRELLNELASLRFVESHHHVAIVGNVGVGKTFLAHALGYVACRRGYSVLALGADQMLKTLKHARLTQSHEKELRALLAVDLLIVDDFGLDAMDAQESRDAHEIIVERHRAGSMIVTSNRGPDEWLATFADPVRAQAAIDRFTSNAYDIVIEGESYRARLKPSQKAGQKAEKKAK